MGDRARNAGLGTLLVLCAAQFMLVLDISVVNVALASVQRELGFTPANLQWVLTAYTLAFGGLLVVGGRAADLFGRRRLFVAGLVVFSGASLLCALAQDAVTFVLARGLQGAGGALVSPAALSLLTTTFTQGAARDRALGAWGAVAAGGGTAGLLLGGVLTDGPGWRWVFLINVPLGLLALAASPRFVPEGRGGVRRRLDLPGALLLTAGLVAVVYGLTQLEVRGPASAPVLAPLGAGALLLGAFAWVERRAPAPLVPARALRSRATVGADLVAALTSAVVVGMSFFVALYLRQVLGYSAIATGGAFLPITLVIMGVSTVVPRLVGRFGARAGLATGAVAFAVGMLLLSRLPVAGDYLTDLLPGLLLCGIGLGASFTAATVAATSALGPSEQGLASGLLNTAQQLGGAVGLAVLATVAAGRTGTLAAAGEPAAAALTGGFRAGFAAAAGFAVLALVAALTVVPRRGAPVPAVLADAPAGQAGSAV